MKGMRSIEFKVGIFFIIAMTILSFIVFKIGGPDLFNRNMYHLNVIFDFVNGIDIDAPVHVAGVKVGKVERVEIFYNPKMKKTQVCLDLLVKNSVKISIDSITYINSLGILGEKYVEIVPGENRTDFLSEGDSLTGNNPVQLEKLTESLVDIVGDQTVRDSLKQSFTNVRLATDNLLEVTTILNGLANDMKTGQGTIGRFISDDSVYVETEKMVMNLNDNLDKTIKDLNISLNEVINDIKIHPWKLFQKPKKDVSSTKKNKKESTSNKGNFFIK